MQFPGYFGYFFCHLFVDSVRNRATVGLPKNRPLSYIAHSYKANPAIFVRKL